MANRDSGQTRNPQQADAEVEAMLDEDYGETIECWQCAGNGNIAGCFEDTCSCTGDPDDPDDCCAPRRCDICRGKSGWKRETGDAR